MESGVSVFVIAGNRLLREALSRILNKKTEISVIGSEALGPESCGMIKASGASVVLLNWSTTEDSDLGFLSHLRQCVPSIKVLLVGMDEDEQLFLRAVQAGALGYVLKDASAVDVIAAVRTVAQEEAVCPPRFCRLLFNYVAAQASENPSLRVRLRTGLTRREQELIPLIARGMTNKEIAAHFGLSEQTIKNHIHRMLQKVGANDRLTIVEVWRMQCAGFIQAYNGLRPQ